MDNETLTAIVENGGRTKVLKHGRFYNKKIQFECECGCVFETLDVTFAIDHNVVSYAAFCPECESYVQRHEARNREADHDET